MAANTSNGPELMTMTEELAAGPNFAAVSTVFPSGKIQTQMIWVGMLDGTMVLNTETHRAKTRNVGQDERIAHRRAYVTAPQGPLSLVLTHWSPVGATPVDDATALEGHSADAVLTRLQRADLLLADQRPDVAAGERLVGRQRGRLDLQQLEVLLQQLIDGRRRPRLLLVVDLGGEPAQGALRVLPGRRAGGDDLTEVVAPLRDRVDSGVDARPQRAAGELLDPAALPSAWCRGSSHGTKLARFAP